MNRSTNSVEGFPEEIEETLNKMSIEKINIELKMQEQTEKLTELENERIALIGSF